MDTITDEAVASFVDGADGIAVKSLIVNITPELSPSADPPSTTNIRPITHFTEVNFYADATQTETPSVHVTIPFAPTSPYTYPYGTLNLTTGVLTVDRVLRVFGVDELDANKWVLNSNSQANGTYCTLAESADTMAQYEGFTAGRDYALCSCNIITNTQNYDSGDGFYWTKTGTTPGWRILLTDKPYASGTLEDLRTVLTTGNAAACLKLANPQTYQLTATEVKTLLGNNAMWANTGNINTLTYYADPTLYTEKEIEKVETIITPNVSETMIAPANISIGDLVVGEHKLYKAISAIPTGTAIVPDTNAELTSIAQELAGITIYDLLDSNPIAHRTIYRGKYLGETITPAQKAAIADGSFHDIWLGDYWGSSAKLTIVDFDYWFNCGDTAFTKHHVVVMPAAAMYTAKMNDTNTTAGGYYGSQMRGVEVDGVFTPYAQGCGLYNALLTFQSVFGDALLTHREYLSNTVSSGRESSGTWYDSIIELPSEIMIYGTSIRTSMPRIATSSKTQLALTATSPMFINIKATYWVRDVVNATIFAFVNHNGSANTYDASYSAGVRPVAAIGG